MIGLWAGVALAWLRKVLAPVLPAIAGVVVGLLIIQTVRIEGISIWPIHIDGLKAEIATARKSVQDVKDAQATATKQWQDAVQHQEAASRMAAAVGETEHGKEVAAARAAGAAYADAHRVCAAPARRDTGDAASTPAPGDPGVRESVPDGSVVVSEGDVQACSDSAAYAVALHNWLVDQPNQQ